MQKPSKLAQIPQIRFAGFTEDWERRKLGDCVDVQSGRDYKHLLEGNIPVYGTGGYMLSVNEALSYNQDAIGIGRKGTIDKPYILKAPFWTVDTLFYALPRENNKLDFLNCIFQKINWKSKDESTGVPSLSKTIINNVDIHIPEATEQNKIGSYFQSLDKLITLHQSKFEKLQKIKKSCLQNLFPQNNQNTPKIRFKNFTDEWVEKKFGEIFKYERPDRFIVKNDEYDEKANTPVLTANKAFILGYTNENNTYNNESIIFDDFTLDCKYVDFPYMVKSSAIKILTIKNKEENNLKFAFESLNSTKFEVMGHARHYIAFIQNTATFVPNLAEQCKISDFFSKLDKLITLQQRKVEKLKNIKKALLNKMFI
ncbi:MAG: restriction endonuclease subunit S [Campylobacter sp.]|nr:restriction endonuclease subunit S [Campylobacter sp.]